MKWLKLEGIRDYQETIAMMETSLGEIINGEEEIIYSLEHSDAYTAGVSARPEELINPGQIPVYQVGRGGKYTYHGPGQLVIYPIIDLRRYAQDLHAFVRNLETIIINSLAQIGIIAFTIDKKIGIWTESRSASPEIIESNNPKKIAAIGIRVKKWVTYHGIAININSDLSKFSGIIPCGISELGVTSVENMGINITLNEFEQIVRSEFNKIYHFS